MKRGKSNFHKLTVAYWWLADATVQERAGGTGIFNETIINYLSSDVEVELKLVPLKAAVRPKRFSIFSITALLRKLLIDAWRLIKEDADILLLCYPGISLVPLTFNVKFPLAFLTYFTLWVKRRFSRQILVILIMDLPIEQAQNFNIKIGASIKLFNVFEGFVFRIASKLIAPSTMIVNLIHKKHRISKEKFLLYRRYAYMPSYKVSSKYQSISLSGKVKIFYAGDLRRDADIANLLSVFEVIKKHPEAAIYLCGLGGEWIKKLSVPNIIYLGLLDYADFDAIARNCDFALMVYPNEFYYNLGPTCKYSAYVANGLAILSTDIKTVGACINEDGVGKALSISELNQELERWIEDPAEFERYKKRAMEISKNFRRGLYIKEWFETIKVMANDKL